MRTDSMAVAYSDAAGVGSADNAKRLGPRKEIFVPLATFSRSGANPKLMGTMDPNWQRVVGELGPKLYRYFCGCFPQQLAHDLVQETLIRLVSKHREGAFNSEKGSLAAFAFGIARFVRLEAQKRSVGFELLSDGDEAEVASVAPLAHDSDPAAHLRWAIRRLSPIEQEILLRMIDEECKLEHIADDLGIPLGTVKSHVHRAKEKIRNLMEMNA